MCMDHTFKLMCQSTVSQLLIGSSKMEQSSKDLQEELFATREERLVLKFMQEIKLT